MKAGKFWGTTEALFEKNNVEIHRIEIKAGGFCSEHRHASKANAFFVESGTLDVLVWESELDGPKAADVTTLTEGQMMTVPPGKWHKFAAQSDVVAYEIYWVELNADDIERRTIGGLAGDGL